MTRRRSMGGPGLLGLVPLLLACSGESLAPVPTPLPSTFELKGTARQVQAGWSVQCEITASFTGARDTPGGWAAAMAGSVDRTITYPDGKTWTFHAAVALPRGEVLTGQDGAVSVPFGGNQPENARDFWKALAPLVGTRFPADPRTYEGPWTCLGLGADVEPGPGYPASGTWILAPVAGGGSG